MEIEDKEHKDNMTEIVNALNKLVPDKKDENFLSVRK